MSEHKIKIVAQTNAGKASVRIFSNIGKYEQETNAAAVRAFVDDFKRQGITEAEVFINSQGGDVFEATEIDSQFERFDKVTFFIGSLAASAATYISSNPKFKVVAKHNSQLMIHKPASTMSGDIEKIKSATKLLENVTASYKDRYASKTGMTVEQIDALWSKGDYWMSAQEAKERGFVNEVTEASMPDEDDAIAAIHSFPGVPVARANWTVSDYLDKDPAALVAMEKNNPVLFQRLNSEHYGMRFRSPATSPIATYHPPANIPATRANWTVSDYLDKDPEALIAMQRDNPALFQRLNSEHYGCNFTGR